MFDIGLTEFNPESPSFLVIFISALFAFFLSSLVAITYELTTQSIYKKNHFIQSLALIGIAAATILQAIGESVAIGLGIIGALSIIRFRTALNDPRNITFMFASLGAGIACGVMGFGVALTGTLVFCLGAILIRFSPLSNNSELIGNLRIRVPKGEQYQGLIEKKLKASCKHFVLERLKTVSPKKETPIEGSEPVIIDVSEEIKLYEFVYLIRLKKSATLSTLEASMNTLKELENLRLEFQNLSTKL